MPNLGLYALHHAGGRACNCKDCGRRFKNQHVLSRYITAHVRERPFGCIRCQGRFKRKYVLDSHIIRVHTGLPSYGCK
ncbi:chorion transcription factor Cf2 [Colletotrichum tamarilloi]|uniref:Chorion transcription factor Cf2 n=1 Tax=Colletotrichum tamarilloi TaxID=1209934 RepID=A0ABQ9QJN9_9PEZI|nr:chorion transcription factor Cf2 [Colletotrichum tamarilloi]KAK1474016.1 chorion transcription factor Cf2 [Colletotrichum tamarilloi]